MMVTGTLCEKPQKLHPNTVNCVHTKMMYGLAGTYYWIGSNSSKESKDLLSESYYVGTSLFGNFESTEYHLSTNLLGTLGGHH